MPTAAEVLFAPLSTNPDDYPSLKPYEPGTAGATLGLGLPGWSDQSIPVGARSASWMREKVRAGTKYDEFDAEAKKLFPELDGKKLRDRYEVEYGVAHPELSATEGSYKGRFADELRHQLPGISTAVENIEQNRLAEAERRLAEGKATGEDKGLIINVRLREKRKAAESELIKAARLGSNLAKTGLEFYYGGNLARGAAAAAGLGKAGTFALEAAGRVATVPSLGGYDATFDRMRKAGRTEPNAQDIAQGFTVGFANSLVAGQIERVGAKGLAGLGATSPAATIPVGAIAGTLEEEVSQAVLKNMNLETRYGPMVELLQGKRGDSVGRLMHSLIGEGIFAGVGALRGPGAFDAPLQLDAAKMQTVVDAGVTALDAEAAAGKTADEAYQGLRGVVEEYGAALRDGKTRQEYLDAVGVDLTPAAEKYTEAVAKTLPEKPSDPFEGLDDQQIKDMAQFAGVARTGKTETIKERLLASDAGRALLIADGRLPRPARPTPAPTAEPAQPEPTPGTPQRMGGRNSWFEPSVPETAPESPLPADPVPEALAPVQVDDRAPQAIPEAPRADRLKRLTMKARDRSAVTAPRPGATEAGTELRRPPEVLSPQQREARAEVLLGRAGEQARGLRELRYRSEAAREAPGRGVRDVGAAEPAEGLTRAERKELKRLAKKARDPDVAPAPRPTAAESELLEARGGELLADNGRAIERVEDALEAMVATGDKIGLATQVNTHHFEASRSVLKRVRQRLEDAEKHIVQDEWPEAQKSLGIARSALDAELFDLRNARREVVEDDKIDNEKRTEKGQPLGEPGLPYFDKLIADVKRASDAIGMLYEKIFKQIGSARLPADDAPRFDPEATGKEPNPVYSKNALRAFQQRVAAQAGWLTDAGTGAAGKPAGASGEPGQARVFREWSDSLTPEQQAGMEAAADAILGQKIDAALAELPDVPADQKQVWKSATQAAYAALPGPLRAFVAQNGQVKFHRNHNELSEAVQREMLADPLLQRDLQSPDSKVRAKAEADRVDMLNRLEAIKHGQFVGLGAHWNGRINIDGAGLIDPKNPKGNLFGPYGPGGKVMAVNEIAAHEIGHQIAYLLGRADQTAGWADANGKDILVAKGKVPKLTNYASESASEGFAEFARLLYASDVATAHIKKLFPNAWEYFRKLRLTPAGRDGRDGPLNEVFSHKIGTDAVHADVKKGSWFSQVRESIGWLEGEQPPRSPGEAALANDNVDKDRAARDLPALATAARLTNPEVWDAAMAKIAADPDLPGRLVNELESTPRPVSVQDEAVLLHREITLRTAHNRAMLDLKAARDSNAPPGDIDQRAAAERQIAESLHRLDRVTKRVGTETARALQFRRQLAKEDYSLSSMLLRAETAAGRQLTEKERTQLGELAARFEAAQDRLAAAEAAVEAGKFGRALSAGAKAAAPAGQQGDMTDLRIAVDKLRKQMDEELASFREAGQGPFARTLSTIGRVLDIFRPLKTAFDLSMIGRQGSFFLALRPKMAYDLTRQATRFFHNEREFDRAMHRIRERPNYTLYEDAGIDFTDKSGPISQQEEVRAGDLWRRLAGNKVPLLSPLARGVVASERSYIGMLNTLRAEMADVMIGTLPTEGRPTLKELRAIGDMVNIGTGRAAVGRDAKQALAHASQVFFSPNYFVSRLQLMVAKPAWGGTKATRIAVGKEYGRYLLGLGVFYGIAHLLFGDEAETTIDPRSSDFGKIKIGDTRIDPLAGIAQITTFAGRSVMGQTKDEAGVVTDLRGDRAPAGGRTTSDVMFDFVRGKLAPVPGEIISVYVGETFDRKPTSVRSVAVGLTVPMSVESVIDGFSKLGVPQATGSFLLNVLGMAVRTHGEANPAQRAIQDAHAMRRRWEYDLGRPPEPRTGAPQTAAMQKATAEDDYEAFRRARVDFLNKQILAGRTRAQARESFLESVERIDPLEGRLNLRDRGKFLASLDEKQKARVSEARKAARERRAKMLQWWRRAVEEEPRG